MSKSATFGVLHLGIAFCVGYALTGSVMTASALMLVEPLVNTVAHYYFDRWWESRGKRGKAGWSRKINDLCSIHKAST